MRISDWSSDVCSSDLTISHGITLFDTDLNLLVCNRHFMTMFGYPAEYGKPGTPFSKFVRWNVEHGEYGPGDVEEMVVLRVGLARRMELGRASLREGVCMYVSIAVGAVKFNKNK